MAKLVTKIMGWCTWRTLVGADKFGNRYFARSETVDGALKERRWVKFKSEADPTTLPVEWTSWLAGRRKFPPTPEEILELEAQRQRIKFNAAMLQREEEKRRFRAKTIQQSTDPGDIEPPNLERFIQDMSTNSVSDDIDNDMVKLQKGAYKGQDMSRSEEPQGSGDSFRPGTWQPN